MLEAAARLAADFDVYAELCLEEYMACAVGGCAGCTVEAHTPDGVAMKRGPGVRPLFIGLISGTSMDGVDAALMDCSSTEPLLVATNRASYPNDLAGRLRAAAQSQGECALREVAALDAAVASCFAEAALALLRNAGRSPEQVEAIGSHGQTLWHAPEGLPPHTVQVGSPARIAAFVRA
ncbi:Anhydro-N-acetylmuramic acid kinase [Geodia barretti]|uniref:Anhydro-N-acetylmuramic acid kinase n=1 Tax=Geodia barretti TaxID=519541 RepID=A0AA35SE63_GEOBA|nr:Anhydro-N-acetylmuramic acid kinase [Geodia barretti]